MKVKDIHSKGTFKFPMNIGDYFQQRYWGNTVVFQLVKQHKNKVDFDIKVIDNTSINLFNKGVTYSVHASWLERGKLIPKLKARLLYEN